MTDIAPESPTPAPPPTIPAFVNPAAGSADDVTAAFGGAPGFELRHLHPSALADAVRQAFRSGAKRVCVAGGDGSVASAAAAAIEHGGELAIIPAGTLNHLAKDLALPLEPAEAIRVAAGTRTIGVDVGYVNDRLFINTSSVGAYATYVQVRERLEHRFGYWLASLVAAVRMVVRLRTFRVTIEVEGVARTYRTPLVFIGVGERELKLPTLGSRVTGGQRGLHVIVVRSRSGARTVALALAAAARGIEAVSRTPALDAFLVDRCTIDAPFRTIAVDGELVRATEPLEYRIAREALRVVVAEEERAESG